MLMWLFLVSGNSYCILFLISAIKNALVRSFGALSESHHQPEKKEAGLQLLEDPAVMVIKKLNCEKYRCRNDSHSAAIKSKSGLRTNLRESYNTGEFQSL